MSPLPSAEVVNPPWLCLEIQICLSEQLGRIEDLVKHSILSTRTIVFVFVGLIVNRG